MYLARYVYLGVQGSRAAKPGMPCAPIPGAPLHGRRDVRCSESADGVREYLLASRGTLPDAFCTGATCYTAVGYLCLARCSC